MKNTAEGKVADPSSSDTDAEIPTSLLDHTTDLDHSPEDDVRNALGEKQVVAGLHVKEFFDLAGNLVGVSYCDPYSRRECHRGRMALQRH
jgi:hypothetical protein